MLGANIYYANLLVWPRRPAAKELKARQAANNSVPADEVTRFCVTAVNCESCHTHA